MAVFDFYDAVINSPVYGSGKYFEEGKYRLVVDEIKIIESQRKAGTTFLIVACTVIESTAEGAKPEDKVTWRVDLTQPSGPSNFKQFAVAMGEALYEGFTEAHVNKEFLDSLFGPEQVAAAQPMIAHAVTIKTRAKTDFTKVTWEAPAE